MFKWKNIYLEVLKTHISFHTQINISNQINIKYRIQSLKLSINIPLPFCRIISAMAKGYNHSMLLYTLVNIRCFVVPFTVVCHCCSLFVVVIKDYSTRYQNIIIHCVISLSTFIIGTDLPIEQNNILATIHNVSYGKKKNWAFSHTKTKVRLCQGIGQLYLEFCTFNIHLQIAN